MSGGRTNSVRSRRSAAIRSSSAAEPSAARRSSSAAATAVMASLMAWPAAFFSSIESSEPRRVLSWASSPFLPASRAVSSVISSRLDDRVDLGECRVAGGGDVGEHVMAFRAWSGVRERATPGESGHGTGANDRRRVERHPPVHPGHENRCDCGFTAPTLSARSSADRPDTVRSHAARRDRRDRRLAMLALRRAGRSRRCRSMTRAARASTAAPPNAGPRRRAPARARARAPARSGSPIGRATRARVPSRPSSHGRTTCSWPMRR